MLEWLFKKEIKPPTFRALEQVKVRDAIFNYLSEIYSEEALWLERITLHNMVDDICNELKTTIRGLKDE